MDADRHAWSIDTRCIDCAAAQTIAPGLIVEGHGISVFARQPSTPEDIEAAWRALLLCPTASVHAPEGLKPPPDLFPQRLSDGVYRLGFNAKSSYGAHSYFVASEAGRAMVDAPRWTTQLEHWIADQGGLDHIFLTHRDDVADADRYAARFEARVWIHEDDASTAPYATDKLRGYEPVEPLPGLRVIPLPGHSKGSVAYLFDCTYLFTGDSLHWDFEKAALAAYADFSWYDWPTQLRSLERLRNEIFSWVLAGHGGSVQLSEQDMQAQLDAMLARYRKA